MPVRTAEATWEGGLQDGDGSVELESGAYEGPYSFQSRFEEGMGTNPEELIGGAEAGCFSMALSMLLAEDDYTPERIHTEAAVRLEQVDGDFAITSVELDTEGTVPEIDESTFTEYAQEAKENCPVSKALGGTDITVNATLN
ncbi:OsmC family protein [Halocatena pleomorpha]|uniref:OsmC family peroxiredoxin n=1 Tax=Halocatena pleomorpha TaxID=1785090 RepID=A0A3P3RFA5_9EURY|nr:OsmC family protein [Halocatena pleomorpha]RRJ31440.1 OsmC family peroxiredoxin [Halocatena pleomorpha]